VTPTRRPRLAVVTSHPIQYHSPWFRGLSAVLDLRVFYAHRPDAAEQARAGYGVAFDWDVDLLSGYTHTFLPNVSRRPDVFHFGGCDTPAIRDELARGGFDALLVTGWYLKSYWQAIRAARRLGLPVLVRGDSQLGSPRSLRVRLAKELLYRWAMGRFDGFLVVGQRNREYVTHYGARAADCHPVPHFVDNRWFAQRSRAAAADRDALRASLGATPADRVVLFVGRFLDFKRPLDLVRALGLLRRRGAPVRGVFVGAGPLEAEIRAEAARVGAELHLTGFRNQSALPALYGAADCLALPSDARETWGLVVNEAMACGLPVVASEQVGSAPDLVIEGQTGSLHAPGDVPGCAAAIERALGLAGTAELSAALAERLAVHSCESAVAGTLGAVNVLCRRGAARR
jgi:glycosyltransferase involved in cell wall biosynthesis